MLLRCDPVSGQRLPQRSCSVMQPMILTGGTAAVYAAAKLLPRNLASPRLYSSMCSLFLESARPVQTAVTTLQDLPQYAQTANCLHSILPQALNANPGSLSSQWSNSSGVAFMPLRPAQVQATLRTELVQRLVEMTRIQAPAVDDQGEQLRAQTAPLGHTARCQVFLQFKKSQVQKEFYVLLSGLTSLV